MELKTIDFATKSFECGGKRFHLKETLSFERYKVLQQLTIEFGYSATFQDLFKGLRKAWDFMNELKLAEASVAIHNMMNGIQKTELKDDVALRMCALFIDEEGEDSTVYDEALMKAKLECWGKELDVLPFFHFAASLVPGWMPAYRLVTQSTSKVEQPKA